MPTEYLIQIQRKDSTKFYGGVTYWYGKTIPTTSTRVDLAKRFTSSSVAKATVTKLLKRLKGQVKINVVVLTQPQIIEVL